MKAIRNFVKSRELLTFLGLTFVFPWVVDFIQIAASRELIPGSPPAALAGTLTVLKLVFMPLGSAAIVTAIGRGSAGLREWFAPVFRWRAGWQWYAVALFSYPLSAFGAIVVSDAIIGRGSHLMEYFNARLDQMGAGLGLSGNSLWLLIPFLLIYGFILVPLIEETGWRGFAIPRLQEKHSALYAAIVMGIVWAVWHLPNFFEPASPHYNMPFIGFLLNIISFSILLVWIYNNTNGSVWMTMMWHGSVIVGSIFFPAGIPGDTGDLLAFWLTVVASVAIAVVVVIVAGPKRLVRSRKLEEFIREAVITR